MVSEPVLAPKGNGRTTALDIVASPSDAFARLRVVPTWGWAFLIAAVLAIVGSFLSSGASEHAASMAVPVAMAKNAQIAAMPAEQRQQMIERQIGMAKTFSKFGFVFVPIVLLFTVLLQSVYLLVLNAATRGQGNFKQFWALAMNVAIVGVGLNALILGVIALIRGPESFNSVADIYGAVPSLAWLVPGLHGFAHGFLASLSVFGIWATALFALGLIAIARIKPPQAYVGAAGMLIVGALISGAFALSQT